jgi:hypothetical protein
VLEQSSLLQLLNNAILESWWNLVCTVSSVIVNSNNRSQKDDKFNIRRFWFNLAIIFTMPAACLASIAIIAGGMAALYGLDWYKSRRRRNRKLTKRVTLEEDHTTKEEQPIAEQIA